MHILIWSNKLYSISAFLNNRGYEYHQILQVFVSSAEMLLIHENLIVTHLCVCLGGIMVH